MTPFRNSVKEVNSIWLLRVGHKHIAYYASWIFLCLTLFAFLLKIFQLNLCSGNWYRCFAGSEFLPMSLCSCHYAHLMITFCPVSLIFTIIVFSFLHYRWNVACLTFLVFQIITNEYFFVKPSNFLITFNA